MRPALLKKFGQVAMIWNAEMSRAWKSAAIILFRITSDTDESLCRLKWFDQFALHAFLQSGRLLAQPFAPENPALPAQLVPHQPLRSHRRKVIENNEVVF